MLANETESPEWSRGVCHMGNVGQARYAAHLAEARFFKRFVLRWRIAREHRRERSRIEPSLHSFI